jgi:deazaflavin-dependent oxidoreductase (nitroreductase family)
MTQPKPPPAWMVRFNAALLRRGLAVGAQQLLSVPGRKTGIARSTPVSVIEVDGSRYVVAAFADADWVANVRAAAGRSTLWRGRREEAVTLTELPIDERGPILRAFLRDVRGGVRFFGSADPDVVVASADRYPVFRVSPR